MPRIPRFSSSLRMSTPDCSVPVPSFGVLDGGDLLWLGFPCLEASRLPFAAGDFGLCMDASAPGANTPFRSCSFRNSETEGRRLWDSLSSGGKTSPCADVSGPALIGGSTSVERSGRRITRFEESGAAALSSFPVRGELIPGRTSGSRVSSGSGAFVASLGG